MREWLRNVVMAVKTVGQGMWITLWYFLQTYKRKAFTQHFEYPELPVVSCWSCSPLTTDN